MSIDTDSFIVVGFVINTADFFKPFLREREEKWHMENRYSPKTGLLIDQEKVIDVTAGYDIVFLGEVYNGPESLVEAYSPDRIDDDPMISAISNYLDASVTVGGDYYRGGPYFMMIEPRCINVKGFIDIASVTRISPELERIGRALIDLGVEPGKCGIHSVINVC